MPKMIPKIPAISAVQKVMYNVWIVASTNSSEIATTLGKYRSKSAHLKSSFNHVIQWFRVILLNDIRVNTLIREKI